MPRSVRPSARRARASRSRAVRLCIGRGRGAAVSCSLRAIAGPATIATYIQYLERVVAFLDGDRDPHRPHGRNAANCPSAQRNR
jgi:hypothetical protein